MADSGSSIFDGLGDIFKQLMDLGNSGTLNFSEDQIGMFSDILPILGFAMQLKNLEAQGQMSEAQAREAQAQLEMNSGPYFEAMKQLNLDKMAHESEMAGFQTDQARFGADEARAGVDSAKLYAQARQYDMQTARDTQMMQRAELLNRMGITQYPGFDRPNTHLNNFYDPIREAFT